MVENRKRHQRDWCVCRGGIEHAIENRADQQRHQPLHRPDHRHQYHRAEQRRQIGTDESKEPAEFLHREALRSVLCSRAASITSETAMSRMSGDLKTAASVFQGAQISWSDGPKSTTEGTPNAAAIWAGPLSFPMNRDAPDSSDLISLSGAPV